MEVKLESGYRTYSLPVEDYDKLVEYYSQTVPFEGTSGKYSISSHIVYPRYKIRASFAKYNQSSTNTRSIAKNESYADYIVLPVKEITDILKLDTYAKRGPILSFLHLNDPNKIYFRHLSSSDYNLLKYAVKVYEEKLTKPIIDFQAFAGKLECLKERLTIPKAQFLIDLLNADSASQKLGMEALTNYDTKRSLPAIFYVLAKAHTLKVNDYWHSTAFKSFRDRVYATCKHTVDSLTSSYITRVYEHLVEIEDVTLTRAEYNLFREAMCEHLQEVIKNNDVEMHIVPEMLTLKFKPENIIEDELVEQEDKLLEESVLEESNSDFYVLVDDTAENT